MADCCGSRSEGVVWYGSVLYCRMSGCNCWVLVVDTRTENSVSPDLFFSVNVYSIYILDESV